MRSKKKMQIAQKCTNVQFTFKEELLITVIDQLGPIIGGAFALAAAWMERKTLLESMEAEKNETNA